MKSAFEKFAELSKEYFVCSLLSDESNDKEDTYFYYDADIIDKAMVDIKKKYPSAEYKIITGYLPNDMTVIWEK